MENEDNLKNEDDLKKEDNLILKTVPGQSLHNLSCACFDPSTPPMKKVDDSGKMVGKNRGGKENGVGNSGH